MITCWPRTSPIFAARMRARVSFELPGALGEIMRTGRFGKSSACASAACDTTRIASATRVFIRSSVSIHASVHPVVRRLALESALDVLPAAPKEQRVRLARDPGDVRGEQQLSRGVALQG